MYIPFNGLELAMQLVESTYTYMLNTICDVCRAVVGVGWKQSNVSTSVYNLFLPTHTLSFAFNYSLYKKKHLEFMVNVSIGSA